MYVYSSGRPKSQKNEMSKIFLSFTVVVVQYHYNQRKVLYKDK